VVRLPKGSRDQFVAAFEQLDAKQRLSFAQHKVEKGDSLAKIARAYGVTEQAVLRTNGLASHRQVRVGRVLVIPVQQTRGLALGETLEDRRAGSRRAQGRSGPTAPAAAPSAAYAAVEAAHAKAAAQGIDLDAQADSRSAKPGRPAKGAAVASTRPASAASRAVAAATGGAPRSTYKVRPGDSLWSIASKFSTTVEHLMHLNRLSRRGARALQVGQKLAVAGAGRGDES
jgi:membrane-bound lytic murein transglycosylase D